MGSAHDSDEGFSRLMDDLQVLYGLRAGYTVTQEDVDALNRVDNHWREEEERVVDAYARGYQDGLTKGGGAEIADLQNKLDTASSELAVKRVLSKFDEQRGFRYGAHACREMLARFVEQGGDASTATSLRANWSPSWGEDPGPAPSSEEQRSTPSEASSSALSTDTQDLLSEDPA